MRYLSLTSVGAVTLSLLAIWTPPAWGATVEEAKPTRTVIGATPWPSPTSELSGPKVIYGTDDRIDLYQENDPDRRLWAASTCGLFTASAAHENNDGTYTIRTSAYDVCPQEPFSSQPTAAFCTGFMVGDDIIATAGHCFSASNLGSVRFIFGFVMENAATPVLTVPAEQVYEGVEILGRALAGNQDYAIIRVDRPIVAEGAVPFKIRREGEISVGTPVGVIGHPSGLPLKLAFGSNTAVRTNDNSGFFMANLDTYGGNSGSPVIDPLTGIVEGILVRGETDFVTSGGCSISNVVPNTGGRGEDVSKTTSFMQFIPELITTNGTLSLNQDSYGCVDELVILLNDLDLAGQPTAAVEVSTSGGDSETVTLLALSAEGDFSGSIPVQGGEIAVGNGNVEVLEGVVLTIRYLDVSHSAGAPDMVVAEAPVDCTAPLVSNVEVVQIGAQYATVQFETNEACSGTIRLGSACGVYKSAITFAAGTSHSVLVQDLLPVNEYFMAIEAADGAGNSVTADNGGACYEFITAETTEYFTQIFATEASDLGNSTILFTPGESGEGYTICRDDITKLPIPNTGATTLVLADDGFAQVSLADGALFPFYGASYDRVFINANGNVTFNQGDGSYEPSAEGHFNAARVSPCFTDLNPSATGSVWYRQMADRLVVTWQGVPHYNSGGTNTVQLELHFDGTIRFSYGALSGLPSTVGLSGGQGAMSDFVSTDFSTQASCGNGTERYHSADTDRDHVISLQETLRVIQFLNLGGYHCDETGTDGFAATAGSETCTPHDSDYNPQDWKVNASELNRLIQFYNAGGYGYDPDAGTEDNFYPIAR